MNCKSILAPVFLALCAMPVSLSFAADETNNEKSLNQIKSELESVKKQYKQQLEQLENKLEQAILTNEETQQEVETLAVEVSQKTNQQSANRFNPAIGVILNGRLISTPNDFEFSLPGFFPIEETGPGEQGLQLGESELNMNANVDDKFYASITLAFGEETEVEEAFIQTTSLGNGFNIKAGRFFSSIGYLSNKHAHSDNFANRPLPYQSFLAGNYGDDGVQATWLAPTELFWESGIEIFRGDSFPAAGAGQSGTGAWTAFTHIGGDFNDSQSWRFGFSLLDATVDNREVDSGESFTGDSQLLISDFIYKWSPEGKRSHTELTLQGEYFSSNESGLFSDDALTDATIDNDKTGWYLQAVYRFSPQWRLGLRTSKLSNQLLSSQFDDTLLDAKGITPKQNSIMLDWSNSEYSRIRLQLDDNDLDGKQHNVWILQYIAAFGAHGAHSF